MTSISGLVAVDDMFNTVTADDDARVGATKASEDWNEATKSQKESKKRSILL